MVKFDLGFLTRFISRGQNRESSSSVFLCSETKRKRLPGRLYPPQADQACCCRREAGERQKTKHRGTMGRGKKGGESEQPLLLIKNYLNVQHNINDALSHNCYKCFHLPNAIGGTNTKLLA